MTKIRAPLTSRVVVIASVLGLAVACHVDVDLANKACPCASGYVCDQARNVCVTPGDIVADAGIPDAQVLACGDTCTCAVDKDCQEAARPRCSPTKKCVECTQTPDTCPAGSYCNGLFQCTLGCKQESDCQVPTVPHCDSKRHQCVECVTNDQCKTAGTACSPSGVCVQSCNSAGNTCTTGLCCNGLCADTQTDPLECGGCDTACLTTNGTPKCAAGMCSWTCASGFAHCDSGNTGCETNIRSDVAHCGSCSKRCDGVVNANNVACTAGACTFTTCMAGFGDCDGNKANGCECACGALRNQACCPGDICTAGLTCNTGSHKCQ